MKEAKNLEGIGMGEDVISNICVLMRLAIVVATFINILLCETFSNWHMNGHHNGIWLHVWWFRQNIIIFYICLENDILGSNYNTIVYSYVSNQH